VVFRLKDYGYDYIEFKKKVSHDFASSVSFDKSAGTVTLDFNLTGEIRKPK